MAELGKIAAVDGLYELRITRRFEATPAEVWSALTEPERLRRWLGTVTYDAAPGSHFSIDFEGGDAVSGEVVEFDPPRVFAFTWREGTGDAGPSIVRFELAEEVRATTLVLTHTRQPASPPAWPGGPPQAGTLTWTCWTATCRALPSSGTRSTRR